MTFIIALAVVAVGYWLIKAAGRAKPEDFRKLKVNALGVGVLILAGFVTLRGNYEAGLGLLAIGLGLLNKDKLLPEFMRRGPASPHTQETPPPSAGTIRMDRAEALRVLGLEEGASREDIRDAHRRLLKDFHPDKGGSNYLAAKINEAKTVLLG